MTPVLGSAEVFDPVTGARLVSAIPILFGLGGLIVGDANGDLQYEPTIGDVSMLVSHLFIDGVPLDCLLEADVNQSGGTNPDCDAITIGDISTLIDYLFISGSSQMTLPDCL